MYYDQYAKTILNNEGKNCSYWKIKKKEVWVYLNFGMGREGGRGEFLLPAVQAKIEEAPFFFIRELSCPSEIINSKLALANYTWIFLQHPSCFLW
jgi:hypothetical protein